MCHYPPVAPGTPWWAKIRGTVSFCSHMVNRMIYVRSPAAEGASSSCTDEAHPLWSAVCSQISMGGHHPGVKMMPGGGILTS
jgi:hypothetical protein